MNKDALEKIFLYIKRKSKFFLLSLFDIKSRIKAYKVKRAEIKIIKKLFLFIKKLLTLLKYIKK